jgi:Tol biopolymer transport system component
VEANNFYVKVSPDGNKIAFTTAAPKAGIWIRDLGSVQARLLEGTAGAISPTWSPDSRSLAYGAGNRLMRVEIAGGPPQVLCESQYSVGSAVWTENGEIVFGHRGAGPILKVTAAGGVPKAVTEVRPGDSFHSQPSLLPDGRHFLYLVTRGGSRSIFVASIDAKPEDQPKEQVLPAQFGASFVRSGNTAGGYLFFVRDGTLMAQPFDSKSMKLAGEPLPVVQQIGTGPAHVHFSVSASGVMAYRTGPGDKIQLAWEERDGKRVEKVGEPSPPVAFSLSPDEKLIALFRSDTQNIQAGDIWLLDKRGIETKLTTGQSVGVVPDDGPVWSPDGKQLGYAAGTLLYVKDVGGAAEARKIAEMSNTSVVTDWTRDGKYLIVTTRGSGADIVAVPVESGAKPSPVIATEFSEGGGRLSPDNNWIAYTSNQSGKSEVYVRPFDPPGTKTPRTGPVIKISKDGGVSPKWRADGKELYFRGTGGLMAAAIEIASDTFRPAGPVPLDIPVPQSVWAVDRAGRFLVAEPLDRGLQTPIVVVTNWEASLKR